MDFDPVVLVVLVSVLGPVLGSLIGVLRRPSERFMSYLLSFAAGIMLSVSFLQLIPEGIRLSSVEVCVAGVVIGSLVMYVFDKIVPHIHPGLCSQEHGSRLERTAYYLFLGIFLHHFPEGMAMAIGLESGAGVGIAVALAIAIHDIPEGICTSAPYFYSSKKRLKSFLISASTAVPTVFGFLLARFLFTGIPNELVGVIMGATAGLMIYISSDELIPAASRESSDHGTIFSHMAGIAMVMLLGLLNI
jgi:ZIP family zinc transporter